MTTKKIDIAEHCDRFIAGHVISSTKDETTTANTTPVVFYPPNDPPREQSMRLVEQSGVIDFWSRPEEDGYTEADGEPL